MEQNKENGTLIGVGVGPGDPELLTLKSLRLIKNAAFVSYLANDEGISQAKNIAVEAFNQVSVEQRDIVIKMPMSTDRHLANMAYDYGAQEIRAVLKTGQDVVFLCEGDPLFFGSFTYILERLNGDFNSRVVPGISSIHAASAALTQALTIQKESFCVVSGRHNDEAIKQALLHNDTVVIMKVGRVRERILGLLKQTNRFDDACYLEYIGRENEKIVEDLTLLEEGAGPYFSLFMICRYSRNFLA